MPAGRSHRLVNRRRRITRIDVRRVFGDGDGTGSITDAVDAEDVGRANVGCVSWSAAITVNGGWA